ncbi:MAG: CoA transferase [Dehalococcoidia bacterium]|nr:CoA transferase [Dehalococcoidia bacterium]
MAGALDGVGVVQVGEWAAVAFAGRTLAQYGAAVTQFRVPPGHLVEPPAGDPRVAESLAAGKAVVDVEAGATGRELVARAMSGATIVLTSRTPPEVEGDLAEFGLAPPAVLVCVTAWGGDGPPAMRTATDLLQYHGGGLGSITPRYANNPGEPPLRLGFPIAEFVTGLNAVTSALAALNRWRETGEPAAVDVSGQQAVAYAMGMYSAFPSFEDRAVSRVSRPELAPYHFLPCRDGWIMVICPEQHQWQSLVDLMGNPDWADSPVFETSGGRAENWDAIEPFLVEWLADKAADDVYRAAQARRIPLAPVSTMQAVLASPQLRHRGFFREQELGGRRVEVPGLPFRSTPSLAAE